MPHIERRSGEIIMRVVYDGAPEAGKTTNIHKLSELVALQRRGDLTSPGTEGRRTEFFDWLDFAGGYVDGRRVRCQIVSVPGQSQLLHRRRYLLNSADAVVFVADSRPDYVAPSLDSIATTLRIAGSHGDDAAVGIVLQANKQDLPGAMRPDDLAMALQLPPETTVLGARAHLGEGVMQTFIRAVRAATDRIRKLAAAGLLGEGSSMEEESPEGLYAAMLRAEPLAPLAALYPSEPTRQVAWVDGTYPHPTEPPRGLVPTAPAPQFAPTEPPEGPLLDEESKRCTNPYLPPNEAAGSEVATEPDPVDLGALGAEDLGVLVLTLRPGDDTQAESAPTGLTIPVPTSVSRPPTLPFPVPHENPALQVQALRVDARELSAGHIWPPAVGRTTLAAAKLDVCSTPLTLQPWVPKDTYELLTPEHILHSRVAWIFDEEQDARLALMGIVRTLLRVARFLPEGRVLFMARHGAGYRIWMLTPRMDSLLTLAAKAVDAGDALGLANVLTGACLIADKLAHARDPADRELIECAMHNFGQAACGPWSLLALPATRPQAEASPLHALLAPLCQAARTSARVRALLATALDRQPYHMASSLAFLRDAAWAP